MSYRYSLALALLFAFPGCHNSGTTHPADMGSGTTRTLVLLHTNDQHSNLIGFGPELDDYPAPTTAGTGAIKSGIGRRAALFAQERAKAKGAGADVLTVGAGDVMQGTLTQVANHTKGVDFTVMKQLGYDVSGLGNHEFDYGPAGLATILNAAQANGGVVPTVATNIHFSSTDPADDSLAALFDESGTDMSKPLHRYLVVTTPNGLKVGFVGIVGADAAKSAPFKAPVTFSLGPDMKDSDYAQVDAQLYKDLQPVVDHLRNDLKVDVVVALSHSGVDTTDDTKGEDTNIATHVNGIDAIVSGHSHVLYPAKLITNPNTGKQVMVQQAGMYGLYIGKMTLQVGADGKVSFDMANSGIINVTDQTIADPTYNQTLDNIISSSEALSINGKPFIGQSLSEITGMSITDDPGKVGDVFFYPLGKIGFDLDGTSTHKETPATVLAVDAELAAASQFDSPTIKTDVALQAEGVIRADIQKGKTGVLAFADVFRTLSLGTQLPDGSFGYPLCRFQVLAAAMKAALELTAGYSYESDNQSSFFLVASGMKVEFDTSRPEFNPSGSAADPSNGRITKITLASDHSTLAKLDTYDKVLFDVNQGGFVAPYNATTLITAAADLYIVSFANSLNVPIYLPDGQGTPITSPLDVALKRPDGSYVQDWEALGQYVYNQSKANGGTLPASYDPAGTPGYPRRMICSGPLCVK